MRPLAASSVVCVLCFSAASAHAERTLKYDEYQPVPPGYHVEERPKTGLAITGGVFTALGATMVGYGVYEQVKDTGYSYVYFIGGGVLTAIGAPLLIVGLTTKKNVLVRDNVAIAPIATPTFGGFAIAATFWGTLAQRGTAIIAEFSDGSPRMLLACSGACEGLRRCWWR